MIFVLAGTKDAREIIERLLLENYKIIATTLTEYGEVLLPVHKNIVTISGQLSQSDIEDIIEEKGITAIIDATHPYAREISEHAIKACENKKILYIRFERDQGDYNIKSFNTFTDASLWLKDTRGNILLTIGTNHLEEFLANITRDRLYVRVLPLSGSIKKCEALGLLPKQILALQGPFSKDFNREVYRQYNIKYLVTKDSGKAGGTPEKIEAAQEENVEVVMITRPFIEYPLVCRNVDDLFEMFKK